MCITCFQVERSKFFVGGKGDGSANNLNGGCTKDWWDTTVESVGEAAAMSLLMDANGEAIWEDVDGSYTISGNRITWDSADSSGTIQVGMVAYIIQNTTPDVDVQTGRYTVTAIDPSGSWAEFDDGINGNADVSVTVRVGGAFADLETAISAVSASEYDVQLFTNVITNCGSGSVDITFGGSIIYNSWLYITGYNTIPSDMLLGGEYYQSPRDCLRNGIDSTKSALIDGEAGANDLFAISVNVDNFFIENFHFTNSTGKGHVLAGTGPFNHVFKNCKYSNIYNVNGLSAEGNLFLECYAHNDVLFNQFHNTSKGSNMVNCFGSAAGSVEVFGVWTAGGSGMMIGCVTTDHKYPVRVNASSLCLVKGNTFYCITHSGVYNSGIVNIINNIFVLDPSAIAGVYQRGNGASVGDHDYNCFIETDGTPAVPYASVSEAYKVPVIGEHTILVDPLFADVDTNNFKLLPKSPCINSGFGSPNNMGAWQRISRIRR